MPEHVEPFLKDGAAPAARWSATALACIAQVPDMVRSAVRRRVEKHAFDADLSEIDVADVEAAIRRSREAMHLGGHKTGGNGS